MGIKDLTSFLRKRHPKVFKEIRIEDLRYKRVAVDTTLYIFKLKMAAGSRWLDGFVNLVASLRKHGIHPIFIYDTKSPPEKLQEQKERADA